MFLYTPTLSIFHHENLSSFSSMMSKRAIKSVVFRSSTIQERDTAWDNVSTIQNLSERHIHPSLGQSHLRSLLADFFFGKADWRNRDVTWNTAMKSCSMSQSVKSISSIDIVSPSIPPACTGPSNLCPFTGGHIREDHSCPFTKLLEVASAQQQLIQRLTANATPPPTCKDISALFCSMDRESRHSLRTTIVSMIQCPSSPSQLRFIHSCDGSSPTGQSGGYCFERYAVFSFAPPFTRPVNTLDPSAWVFRGNSRTQLSQDMMTCTKIGTSRNQWNCNVMGSLGELPCVFRLSLNLVTQDGPLVTTNGPFSCWLMLISWSALLILKLIPTVRIGTRVVTICPRRAVLSLAKIASGRVTMVRCFFILPFWQ